MQFIRITSAAHPQYPAAMALYRSSFPPHEQREDASQRALFCCKDYHFTLLYEGERFAGLLLYWDAGEMYYVEHFCIEPALRGRGCGARALAQLGAAGKPIVLEIDPPADEISRRRRGFYTRCGFAENPYPHVHPPYHRGAAGHALTVMSTPRALRPAEYKGFARYLAARVMAHAFD